LCLANYTLCRVAMEAEASITRSGDFRRQLLSPSRIRLLINGDDLIFQCGAFGRRVWSWVGRHVFGLIESVGKTYWSAEFLEMNSRLHYYDPREDPDREVLVQRLDGSWGRTLDYIRTTPLINMGLLKGVKRSQGVVGVVDVVRSDREMDLGSRMAALDSECQTGGGFGYGVKRAVRRAFLAEHMELLRQVRLPWYVPQRFGGLGLIGTPSDMDVRCMRAAAFSNLHFTTHVGGDWRCWQIASERLKKFKSLRRILPARGLEASNRVQSLMVVDLLFDQRMKIDQLLCTDGLGAKYALRHNERLWAKLSKGKYGMPSLSWKFRNPLVPREGVRIGVSFDVAGSVLLDLGWWSGRVSSSDSDFLKIHVNDPDELLLKLSPWIELTDKAEILSALAGRWASAIPFEVDLYD